MNDFPQFILRKEAKFFLCNSAKASRDGDTLRVISHLRVWDHMQARLSRVSHFPGETRAWYTKSCCHTSFPFLLPTIHLWGDWKYPYPLLIQTDSVKRFFFYFQMSYQLRFNSLLFLFAMNCLTFFFFSSVSILTSL